MPNKTIWAAIPLGSPVAKEFYDLSAFRNSASGQSPRSKLDSANKSTLLEKDENSIHGYVKNKMS